MSWEHSADYPLPKSKDWTSAGGSSGFTKTYKLGAEHAFLADHVVDGRILMPVRSCPSLPSLPASANVPASANWKSASTNLLAC